LERLILFKKPLEEKRKDIYDNFSQEDLHYYHNLGVIDQYNLSDVECLNLIRAAAIVVPFLKMNSH